jgi:hypothetical protein
MARSIHPQNENAGSVRGVRSVPHSGKTRDEIIYHMAVAVAEIAEVVKTASKNPSRTPMLGSKILSFFFPDFFPVWDTEWIGHILAARRKEAGETQVPAGIERRLSPNGADQDYASYVNLMIRDTSDTTKFEYDRLRAAAGRCCVRAGYDRSKHLLDEFFYDLTPVLFEACLMGRAARQGEL